MRTIDDRPVRIALGDHLMTECINASECTCKTVECRLCWNQVAACQSFVIYQYLTQGTTIGATFICVRNECTNELNKRLSALLDFSQTQQLIDKVTA